MYGAVHMKWIRWPVAEIWRSEIFIMAASCHLVQFSLVVIYLFFSVVSQLAEETVWCKCIGCQSTFVWSMYKTSLTLQLMTVWRSRRDSEWLYSEIKTFLISKTREFLCATKMCQRSCLLYVLCIIAIIEENCEFIELKQNSNKIKTIWCINCFPIYYIYQKIFKDIIIFHVTNRDKGTEWTTALFLKILTLPVYRILFSVVEYHSINEIIFQFMALFISWIIDDFSLGWLSFVCVSKSSICLVIF